jgi:ElaB/YqjD/DUF883 family membrane-anchored ribosome-binding protein
MFTTRDQLGKQAEEVTEDLQEMGRTVRDAAQEKLGQLRKNASECCEQGREQVRHAQHAVGHFIRGLPIKSVLIAAGVGFLLGRSWPRR